YTLEFYHRYNWIPRYENSFYMAYNKTLGFLNWSKESYFNGNLFLVPTPVNLTLIGETVKAAGPLNYSINGTKIIFDYGNNTRIEVTIDSSGVSTLIEKITNNTTIYKWELNTEEIIIKVPLGNYFLAISILTISVIILFKNRKLKKSAT
ncbi:MAG: hypothetical protein ACFE96_13805, partial [Candidatus Hermodarchaeota archaeon]